MYFRCEDAGSFASKISPCGLLNPIELAAGSEQTISLISFNGNRTFSSEDTVLMLQTGFTVFTWLWQERLNDGVLVSFSSQDGTVFTLSSIGSARQVIFRYSHPIRDSDGLLSFYPIKEVIFSNITLDNQDFHSLLFIFSPASIELLIDGIAYSINNNLSTTTVMTVAGI